MPQQAFPTWFIAVFVVAVVLSFVAFGYYSAKHEQSSRGLQGPTTKDNPPPRPNLFDAFVFLCCGATLAAIAYWGGPGFVRGM